MAADPFFLPPRSVVSFSGGRTSGLMLRRILDAHGGKLPEDIVVVFCNTGREREETLRFVQECSERWNVPIIWLEYVATPSGKFRPKDGKPLWKHTFRIVDFSSASRSGEPFDDVIRTRNFLPNPVMRFCTGELKIKTTNRYVRQSLGWAEYTNAIGLRHDEPTRVATMLHIARTAPVDEQLLLFPDDVPEEEATGAWKKKVPGETPLLPLNDGKITLADVEEFWAAQPFKLDLKPYEGNCDGCFLKGVNKLLRTFAVRPDLADWWGDWEGRIATLGLGAKARNEAFRADRPRYHELKMAATGQTLPGHFDFGPPDLSEDGRGCSVWDDCACTD